MALRRLEGEAAFTHACVRRGGMGCWIFRTVGMNPSFSGHGTMGALPACPHIPGCPDPLANLAIPIIPIT